MKKNWAEPRAMARVARGVHPPLPVPEQQRTNKDFLLQVKNIDEADVHFSIAMQQQAEV